jgi:hypothetical protein
MQGNPVKSIQIRSASDPASTVRWAASFPLRDEFFIEIPSNYVVTAAPEVQRLQYRGPTARRTRLSEMLPHYCGVCVH